MRLYEQCIFTLKIVKGNFRALCDDFFFKMLEDPVQGQRIKVVIDGVTDSAGTAYDGLLGIN